MLAAFASMALSQTQEADLDPADAMQSEVTVSNGKDIAAQRRVTWSAERIVHQQQDGDQEEASPPSASGGEMYEPLLDGEQLNAP